MAAARKSGAPVLRSLSPSGRFYSRCGSLSSSTSTSTTFSSSFINLYPCNAVRFSIDRATSPKRSIAAHPVDCTPKKTCLCSPTNHPGSFRCSLHKTLGTPRKQQPSGGPYQSNRLFARRSAMTNSLVRIGTVEGDVVKRALAALIRPSSHHQRRRADFQPQPTRLSLMSKPT